MKSSYSNVVTRFLRQDERLVSSEETEVPLVIEAKDETSVKFLQDFLASHSAQILEDIGKYGAVLLRGFDIKSEEDFESTVLSIQGIRGISDAFMSEQGRIHVDHLKYVLHTNAAYKTGGTLYLGGFHSENYYSPDVPAYINFCCLKPSEQGGETGLINMEKIYEHLDDNLKERLEKNTFFASKWNISEVVARYQLPIETIEKICKSADLPIIGSGSERFVLMYKPSVIEHSLTKKKSLFINLFEIPGLNEELRKCFMNDYQGKTWFWHRFVWNIPSSIFKSIEVIYLMFASLIYSPKESFEILKKKINALKSKIFKSKTPSFNSTKVGSCFSDKDIKTLAQLMRTYYSSCLWKKGDILLIDNRKIMHAGMPGVGPRLIRVMICNPLEMKYSFSEPGYLNDREKDEDTIGSTMKQGK